MSEDEQKGLGTTFGGKTKGSQISYGHPFSKKILEDSRKILKESETGRLLLKVSDVHKIPIHVIKGQGASGFSADSRVVYLQVPGKMDKAIPENVIQLIIGLRGADQELIGFTAPDPRKDLMEYATVIHAKNLDALVYVCKVIKELTNSSYFTDLLDGLKKLGHIEFYKAYIADASREELFDVYARS